MAVQPLRRLALSQGKAMTYREGFDSLGNQVPPPKPDWQHRAIQYACGLCIAACVFILVWMR